MYTAAIEEAESIRALKRERKEVEEERQGAFVRAGVLKPKGVADVSFFFVQVLFFAHHSPFFLFKNYSRRRWTSLEPK